MGDDRALAEIFADDVVWHVSDEFRGQAGLWGWHEDTKAAEGAEGAFDEHVQVPTGGLAGRVRRRRAR
jgi:hypothetical protein